MAIATYSDLQASVASFLHRTDLTTEIKDFISLAESDLQVRAKLSQWDTTATVSLTSGVGALPSDFQEAQSVTYSTYTLSFMPVHSFDEMAASAESGSPYRYTIKSDDLHVYPQLTGDVTLAYTARFTALSDSATSNSLLTLFPDAYLYGALMHSCVWTNDDQGAAKYAALFEQCVGRVRTYIAQYKYPTDLVVRVA